VDALRTIEVLINKHLKLHVAWGYEVFLPYELSKMNAF
jgi:hypothetical protein